MAFFLPRKCGFIQNLKVVDIFFLKCEKQKSEYLLSSVSVIYVFQAVETKDHTGASVLVQYITKIRKRKLYDAQTCIHLSEISYFK
jgi:hypothetical protein